MSSLYTEINDALIKCPITKNQYLPLNIVDDKITVERVKESVPVRFKLIPLFQVLRDRGLTKQVRRAKKIIAILALIDRLNKKSMKALAFNNLTDEHLPLSRDGKQLKCRCHGQVFLFPSLGEGDADRFMRQQWMVITPHLDFKTGSVANILLEEHCAFPFSSIDIVEKTTFSEVYEARYAFLDGEGEPRSLHLAVKKFIREEKGAEYKTDYKKEKENLEKIQSENISNKHLLTHLGVCDRVHCIMFPWANGKSLDSLWQEANGKNKALDIFQWSLEQLVGLSHALSDLHRANIRHGDLKPSNILRFTETEHDNGILKIADVGVSKAHAFATDLRQGETMTRASTLAYEGPEASDTDRNKTPRSRKFDCWSMGCIIVEFVIWILYDYDAIEGFKQSRTSPNYSYYEPTSGGSSEISGWWDTMKRHVKVDEAIDVLQKDKRCHGTFLEKVIDIANQKLLVIRPDQRISASELHKELQCVLESCQKGSMQYMNDVQSDGIPEIFAMHSVEPINNSVQYTYDAKKQADSEQN